MKKLLEQVMDKTVPDGYVYNTASGSYFYKDGSWLNGKTLQMVHESKTARMNLAALQQISSLNESNAVQIGKSYTINHESFMYLGNNTFTKNGNYLSESAGRRTLAMLTESVATLEIPPGYLLDVPKEDNEYLRGVDGKWTSTGGNTPDDEKSTELDIKALEEINYKNRHNDYQIGDAVEFNGKEYAYVGDAFVEVGTAKRLPYNSKVSNVLFDKYSERENYPYYETGSSSELKDILKKMKESIGQSTEDTSAPAKSDEHVVDQEDLTDTAQEADADKSEEQKPEEAPAQDTQEEPKPEEASAEPEAKADEQKPEEQPEPAASTASSANDSVLPDEQEEISEDDISPKVPNGYVSTSRSGKRYVKRKNVWYEEESNKVLNSSASSMVERAAMKAIETYNKDNEGKEIPIGQEYTSNSGTVFTWNGTTFVDPKGRLLPKTALGTVLQYVRRDLGLDGAKNDAANTDDADKADDTSTDAPKQDSQKADTAQNNDRSAANDDVEDPLKAANDDIDFDEEVPAQNSQNANSDSNDTTASNDTDTDAEPSSDDLSQGDGEEEDEYLKRLAAAIKSNSNAPRITVLLGRGDPVSLLAADILLSGKQKEATDIINSLNTNSGN